MPQAIRDGLLLSPDTTTATVPAGALAGLDGAMVVVRAIGPVKVVGTAPTIRVSTDSVVTMVLAAPGGGRGFGGRGFGPPQGNGDGGPPAP
jgi:hypothetical protein